MKKIFILMLAFTLMGAAYAQDEKEETKVQKGFKKEKLFTGGGVTASFFNGATVLGVTPHFGYSVTNWLDAALVFNFNYTSQRDYQEYGDKLRQTVYGPGAFIRLFPVRFLFAQAQFEHNFLHLRYIPATNGTYLPNKVTLNANSLLVGAGYTGGRSVGNNSYYYISILFDVLGDKNSPYVDNLNRGIPIIRAGYNIGLFQNRHAGRFR
ncbi:MAG: hypothetical protein ABJA57_02705 [Ginsengibacter sp.]